MRVVRPTPGWSLADLDRAELVPSLSSARSTPAPRHRGRAARHGVARRWSSRVHRWCGVRGRRRPRQRDHRNLRRLPQAGTRHPRSGPRGPSDPSPPGAPERGRTRDRCTGGERRDDDPLRGWQHPPTFPTLSEGRTGSRRHRIAAAADLADALMVELDPRRPPVTSAPPIVAVAEVPVELDHAARSHLAVRCTQGCDALPRIL